MSQGDDLRKYVRSIASGLIGSRAREGQMYQLFPRRSQAATELDENAEPLEDVDPLDTYEGDAGIYSPLTDLEEVDLEGGLLKLLREWLSDSACRMLIARYVEDTSVAEIAKKEHLTQLQVVKQLNKARELVRLRLSERMEQLEEAMELKQESRDPPNT